MPLDPSGKFQLVQTGATVPPNKCAVHGGYEGPFIEWGLDIEWYGKVYMCFPCATQLAVELDFSKPGAVDELNKTIADRDATIKYLRDENEQLLHDLGVINKYNLVPERSGSVLDSGNDENNSSNPGGEAGSSKPDTSGGLPDLSFDDIDI